MPANTTDQQLTLPIDPDTADNPVAFTDFAADVETRLVSRYANLADRTARYGANLAGRLSWLTSEGRIDADNGSYHASLLRYSYTGFARRTADATPVNNSTTLVSDAVLVLPVTTTATYTWEAMIFYDASTAADAKFAFTWPAGSTARWGIMGISTAGTTDMTVATTNASGTALPVGGNAVSTIIVARMFGDITTGGTAGNLQLQYAQNTLDASNFTVRLGSRLWIARV